MSGQVMENSRTFQEPYTLFDCMLGNFAYFLLSVDFFSSKLLFSFRNTITVSKQFVGPALPPNYWQRLSSDDKSCPEHTHNMFSRTEKYLQAIQIKCSIYIFRTIFDLLF